MWNIMGVLLWHGHGGLRGVKKLKLNFGLIWEEVKTNDIVYVFEIQTQGSKNPTYNFDIF